MSADFLIATGRGGAMLSVDYAGKKHRTWNRCFIYRDGAAREILTIAERQWSRGRAISMRVYAGDGRLAWGPWTVKR